MTCNPNTLVVIILGGATNTITRDILLGGGLTADQVLFYTPTGSLTMTPASTGVDHFGTFINGSGAMTIGHTSSNRPLALPGHLYANTGAITFQSRGGSQDDLGMATPEPGTWVMMIGGFALRRVVGPAAEAAGSLKRQVAPAPRRPRAR